MSITSTTHEEMKEVVPKAKSELLAEMHKPSKQKRALVERALEFSHNAHKGQFRASGEPYIIHPIAVAKIIMQQKLDDVSIVAALLHDTIEDTDVRYEDIVESFGEEVAVVVEGVTKLTKIENRPRHIEQADNFRKLFLALSKDIRILLIKLADRLHNMRTLDCIPKEEKRKRIAQETLDIYSPLAERIGIQIFKNELEDLAFSTLFPKIKSSIINKLEFFQDKGQQEVEEIKVKLLRSLDNHGVKSEISYREKTPYSIWAKMEKKSINFEELSDITAFRVLVPKMNDCYKALGIIHSEYKCIPKKFKDYISMPKDNGYKSLHTSVVGGPQGKIEIQIRTHQMHEIAEYGLAMHWAYKQNEKNLNNSDFKWVKDLMEVLKHSNSPEELLENTKMDMYSDQVFCFTPIGDLIQLPKRATPVDFAFTLHSQLGLLCAGAKINNKIVSLNTKIQNGDQVEILLGNTPSPSSSWENFVVTGRAKSTIRKFTKDVQRIESINLGRVILVKVLQKLKETYNEKNLLPLLQLFQKRNIDDFLLSIGRGLISKTEIVNAITEKSPKKTASFFLLKLKRIFFRTKKLDKLPIEIPVQGLLPGDNVFLSGCCNPIPGDKIIGIIHPGKLVAIHVSGCKAIMTHSNSEDLMLNLSWGKAGKEEYSAKISVNLLNYEGNFYALFKIIAEFSCSIINLEVLFRSEEVLKIMVELQVRGIKQLGEIIKAIKSSDMVYGAERFKYDKK